MSYAPRNLDEDDANLMNGIASSSAAATNAAGAIEGAFRCITCKRGPPHTKKYAKN